MDHFAIVAPNALATAQFIGIPVLCCAFAIFAHFNLPRTTPVLLLKGILVIAAFFQLRLYLQTRNSEVRFVDDRMQFKVPGFYERSVDLHHVDFDAIQIVDLNKNPELQTKYRTNGIGLVGYSLGWHRLNNQRTAWVAITDWTRVVVIPEYEGPTVLVSVVDPEAFTAYLASLVDRSESADDE